MLRRIVKWLSWLVVSVLVLFAAAFGLAQTRLAKEQLSGLITERLSSPTQTAEVEQLTGLLPFDVRIGRFALADQDGGWVEAEDIQLKVKPAALFAGQIHVEQAGARTIRLKRLPTGQAPGPEARPAIMPQLPKPPESLPVFAVDRLHIAELRLEEAVLGKAATFTIGGRLRPNEDGTALDALLEVRRTDEATAEATFLAQADLRQQSLHFDLAATDLGGLVAAALGQPEAGAARLRLRGGGPVADFRAELRAEIERLARLEAALALTWAAAPELELQASLAVAPGALPPAYAAVFGSQATLELAFGESQPGKLALRHFVLQTAAIEAEGFGTIDREAGTIEGQWTATLADLSRASQLAGTPLAGALNIAAEAKTDERGPVVEIRVDGRGLVFDRFALASLGAELTLIPAAPLRAGWQGAAINGTLSLREVSFDAEPLPALADLDATLALDWEQQGTVAIRALQLSGRQFALSGSGHFQPADRSARLDVRLALPDLAAFLADLGPMRPTGLALAGRSELQATLITHAQLAAIDAQLALKTSEFSGLPAGAAALFGREPAFRAELRYIFGDQLTVSQLEVIGTAARLTGSGSYRQNETALDGRLTLTVPELSALAPLVGQPLAGAARLEADLGGKLDAPQLTARLAVRPLALGGMTVDGLEAVAVAEGPLHAAAGHVSLVALRGSSQLQLNSRWRHSAQTLQLSELALLAPATQFSGQAQIQLAGPLIDGELAGAIADLTALEVWTGDRVAGRVDLKLELAARGGMQLAAFEAKVAKLAGRFGGLYEAALKLSAEDLFGRPRLQATLEAREFTQPSMRLRTVSAQLSGPAADLGLALFIEGERDVEAFQLRAEAAIAALDTPKRLVLHSLEGLLGGQTLSLRKPATAVLDRGVLSIDELDLVLGDGEIRGGLHLEPAEVRGFAEIERLPLSVLAHMGGPAVAGEAQLALRLEGTARWPRLAFAGRLTGLRPADDVFGSVPAAELIVRGAVADGQLRAAFQVEKLEGTTARGEISIPLHLRFAPLLIELHESAPLAGTVEARFELATLAAFAGFDRQRLAGPLTLVLTLAGTPAKPELSGSAAVERARIEDSMTGILISDLVLRLDASGDRLRLVELRGRDGREGRLTGKGELRFGGPAGFVYEAQLDLDDFLLANTAMAWVMADGQLTAVGDGRRSRISGRIAVEAAEIGIPSGGGPRVPELAVVEINGQTPRWQPDWTAFGRSVRAPIYEWLLDVRVEAPGRVFVRGRGLQSEWGGQLQVTGTATAPVIQGQLSVRRGYLDVLDRRFTIRRGEIRFPGTETWWPEMTIDALARGGEGLSAIAHVAGRVDQLRVYLTSDPPLPQDEILARLLFGRDRSAMTPLQGLRLAAALAQLAGDGGLDALATLRERIGFDTLAVGGESPAEAYVSAGKYVAENVFLEVEQRLFTGETRARVELELNERLSIVSETGAEGTSSIELRWRYDY